MKDSTALIKVKEGFFRGSLASSCHEMMIDIVGKKTNKDPDTLP